MWIGDLVWYVLGLLVRSVVIAGMSVVALMGAAIIAPTPTMTHIVTEVPTE